MLGSFWKVDNFTDVCKSGIIYPVDYQQSREGVSTKIIGQLPEVWPDVRQYTESGALWEYRRHSIVKRGSQESCHKDNVLGYAPCKNKYATGRCQPHHMAGVNIMVGVSSLPTNPENVQSVNRKTKLCRPPVRLVDQWKYVLYTTWEELWGI